MKLHLWGTDFRRSSSEFRKALALPIETRAEMLAEARSLGFADLVYLWTCNRVEFYTTAPDYFHDTRHQWAGLLKLLGVKETDAYYRGYHLEGKAAVRHLVRVACSLESLVIGEPQILGQLKDALAWSKANGLAGDSSIEKCFHIAFEIAKRVRTETTIAERPVSLATLSLQNFERTESEFPGTHIAIVGRSPMARAIIQWFHESHPAIPLTWVNRSPELLLQAPEHRYCEVMGLSEFLETPTDFSHLFTATSSVMPIFQSDFLERLGEKRRILYDLAEPQDIASSSHPQLTILRMEDFRSEAELNAKARSAAALEAEQMIQMGLRDFFLSQKEAPILRDFGSVESVFLKEIEEAWRVIDDEFAEDFRPRLKKFAEKIIKKNLHLSREHLRFILRQYSSSNEGKEVAV